MLYITLLCDNGMSTSMMVQRMEKCAKERGLDVDIAAVSVKAMKERLAHTDVLLLGPQVRYLLSKMKAEYEPTGIAVADIPPMDYGRMNGESVLDLALKLSKERENS